LLRTDPGLDRLVSLPLLGCLLARRLEHLLLALQPRDVGRDLVLLLVASFRALLLVGDRQPDEGGPIDRPLVLDLRREAGRDLVERNRRRLERQRLMLGAERSDTAGRESSRYCDPRRRRDGVLELLDPRVGEHLVLELLDRLRLEQRLACLLERLLLLLVVALRLAVVLTLDRSRRRHGRERPAGDGAAARDDLGRPRRLALVAGAGPGGGARGPPSPAGGGGAPGRLHPPAP